jgi:hypothetical protein
VNSGLWHIALSCKETTPMKTAAPLKQSYPSNVSYPITDEKLFKRAQEHVIVTALSLMQKYGIGNVWKFKLNNNRSSLGICRYHSKTIEISNWNIRVNPFSAVKNTILHEIAHVLAALCGEYGHGPIWKEIAISIGCDGERCSEMVTPPKYIATCPSCSRTFGFNKKSKRRMACSSCCERYNNNQWNAMFVLTYTRNS